ncbi:MAG: 3-deoxy-7-phosphoheptulonate synthase [Planctomycetaceae bacterium]|jgi:3-deoxy-7-phosphoheptulonate synthase|nr:3-deoxy-7-phosphoheptulonate synthase [Planctomycetaceae bacterium]
MLIYPAADKCTDKFAAEITALLARSDIRCHYTRFGERPVIVADDKSAAVLPILQPYRETIEETVDVDEPYQLASKRVRPNGTVIHIRDFIVGGGHFGIIAGPCTIETESQVLTAAELVKKGGATALRGGAFKPRTSPYAFQGLKLAGLKILQKAAKETGLATVTEAMSSEEVKLVAEYADVVQIGTRNAQNYRLLETCGEMRIPILLKRGYSCSLDEFLMSAEYILAGGNDQVILCERGIRTFENYIRYTLPIAAVPMLKTATHLPLVVDPSHAAGRADLVPSLSFAAVAAGSDGLLVEVHPDPKHALCDGRQSLTPEEFAVMTEKCRKIRTALQ